MGNRNNKEKGKRLKMKIVSINTSKPIEIEYEGRVVRTSIFKNPVQGPVYVSKFNVEGDQQADRDNHGGEFKAVYAYSYDHYTHWADMLERSDLEYGHFGETITVTGLDESTLCIGDQLQAGEVVFTVTQPRVPCYKLAIRFDDKEMPKKFLKAALTGCYFKVLQEGNIQVGDNLSIIKRDENQVSVKSLFESYNNSKTNSALEVLRNSLKVTELSPSWKSQIEKRLSEL